MRLGFKIVGVPEAADALNEISDEMAGQKLADATMAGAHIIRNEWKRLARFLSGEYKRSIHAEVTHQSKDRAEVTIGTDIVKPPYPWVLEFGMTIRAKNKPYMVFQTKDGQWHSVKVVTIPPYPSARPAFDNKQDEAAREIEETLLGSVGLIWR